MSLLPNHRLPRIPVKLFWVSGFILASLTIIGAGIASGKVQIASDPQTSILGEAEPTSAAAIPLAIETVGANDAADGSLLGTSWPGEIVSLGDLEIQPVREGTIVQWFVGVGQKVSRGQAVARMSAPPDGPEITQMLAEQAKMVAEAKTEAVAMANYAEKNKKQLLTLRASYDKNIKDVGSILNNDAASNRSKVIGLATNAVDQARAIAVIRQKKVRTLIEQALTAEFPEIVSSPKDPFSAFRSTGYFTTTFDESIGVLDVAARAEYVAATLKVLNELKDPAAIPDVAGTAYFRAASRVAAASVASEGASESRLAELRKMVSDDFSEFLMAVADAQEAKTEVAMKDVEAKMQETEYDMSRTEADKDFAMQKKEIDEKISMLEKDVELAQGKVRAAQVSYSTVARGLTEGLNIVAPRDGIISAIMNKNGDFVSPGMPVASLNSGDATERFVRFYIPSNLQAPEPGTMLSINRPGFPTDTREVRLVGVGTALDENGSYVADADFVEQRTDWPVGASVRVMAPESGYPSFFIPLSAIWWDEDGKANLWVVEGDVLHARTIITGRALSDSVEVKEGIKKGERYVSKPLPNMKDGMKAVGTSADGSSKSRTGGDMHGGMDMN